MLILAEETILPKYPEPIPKRPPINDSPLFWTQLACLLQCTAEVFLALFVVALRKLLVFVQALSQEICVVLKLVVIFVLAIFLDHTDVLNLQLILRELLRLL